MKKFIDIMLGILLIISVASYFGSKWILKNYAYHFAITTYHWGVNDKAPGDSIGADSDSRYTFVVNYYANKDNSGVEMYEIKLNYYTDFEFSNVYSLGVQYINPSSMECKIDWTSSDVAFFPWNNTHFYFTYFTDFNNTTKQYFNTDDGISFNATETFNSRNVPYIINIEDKAYAFDFNKENIEHYSTNWAGGATYMHYTSDFDYFLYKVFDSTTHISDGDGIHKNLKLELLDVFNLYEYNPLTGKFDKQTTFGYDPNYVSFKVNYHSRGATRHEDSLFKQIGSEPPGGVIWGNS